MIGRIARRVLWPVRWLGRALQARSEDLAAGGCLAIMLGLAVWSVEHAKWITPGPSLLKTFVIALLAGYILARSRLPGWVAHPLSVLLAMGVMLWQGMGLVPASPTANRLESLFQALGTWWQDAVAGIPSAGVVQVGLMFVLATWIIAYVSTWLLFRQRNPWVAVFLGAAGVLVNLSYRTDSDYYFFFLYLVAALLLVVVMASAANYSGFGQKSVARRVGLVAVLLAVVTVSVAWQTPEYHAYNIESLARTRTSWRQAAEEHWNNFFAGVPANKPTLAHGGKGPLRFSDSLKMTDKVLFLVKSDLPRYWRTQTYDTYNGDGWVTSPSIEQSFKPQEVRFNGVDKPVSEMTYTVIPQVYTDVLLGTGDFGSSSLPVIVRTLEPQTFNISLLDRSGDAALPGDIADGARTVRRMAVRGRTVDSQLESTIPGALKLVSVNRRGDQVDSITVTRNRPDPQEGVNLSSLQSLRPNQRYTMMARVLSASTTELSGAGTEYPPEITDRFLQLPRDLPKSVRDLAKDVTRDAKTPYEKAEAIRTFLYTLNYSLEPGPIPAGVDGVEHFLFTLKSGYCVHFASAMTVMLRSLGIPTRLSIGFMGKTRDTEKQAYVIKDMDFHAWPEIYFPGYGWSEFEATPGRGLSLLDDEDGSGFQEIPEDEYTGGFDGLAQEGGGLPISLPLAIAMAAAVMAVALAVVGYRRFVGFGATTTAVYGRMCLMASLVGLGPRPGQTPLEYSAALSGALRAPAEDVDTIARSYSASRYGRPEALDAGSPGLTGAWHRVRRYLLKRLFRL